MIKIYIFGMIGFFTFEALRIYKRLWSGLKIPPLSNKYLYCLILIGISILSGFIACVFSPDNTIKAIYIGFSVPTGLKALIESPRKEQNIDFVDDIKLDRISLMSKLFLYIKNYFVFTKH